MPQPKNEMSLSRTMYRFKGLISQSLSVIPPCSQHMSSDAALPASEPQLWTAPVVGLGDLAARCRSKLAIWYYHIEIGMTGVGIMPIYIFVFHGNHVLSNFGFLQLFLSMLDMHGACSPKHVDVMSDFFRQILKIVIISIVQGDPRAEWTRVVLLTQTHHTQRMWNIKLRSCNMLLL